MSRSIEVISEMLRAIKEDQLPSMHREVTQRLDTINGAVKRHEVEIDTLKQYRESHKGEIRGMKLIGGIIVTVIGILIASIKIFAP